MGTITSSETIILDLLRLRKSLRMEQVIELAPELTWNQVFTTIDSLSRRGEIALLRRGFEYEVAWLPVRGQAVACSA
ncbi:MAG: hypothetical protein KF814_13290 [Nitrospiraceae bacterium]|nr:hypothetical protein [Nitrospiraceae bacterium]